jgi:hypothetical protein
MKKINLLLALLFAAFMAINTHAQVTVPKSLNDVDVSKVEVPDSDFTKSILKALDPGKSFTSPDKYMKLLTENKDMVSDVLGVMNGAGSEADKLAKVDQLKGEHKDFVEQLLGEGKAAEYYRLVKKNIEPLTQKFKLAKLFL